MSKHCVYCGAAIEPTDRFCGICGKPNKRAAAPTPPAEPIPTKPHIRAMQSPAPPPPMPDVRTSSGPLPAAAQTGWTLLFQNRTGQVSRHLIDGETRIGRHPDCEIVVEDSEASRYHVVVSPSPGGLTIVDQNSTNGTYVNGRRIESPTRLSNGDVVVIGECNLTVVAPQQGTAQFAQTVAAKKPSAAGVAASGSSRTCPFCQTVNPPGVGICQGCGRRF